jgi:hypothetical protein
VAGTSLRFKDSRDYARALSEYRSVTGSLAQESGRLLQHGIAIENPDDADVMTSAV